jgi:cholesterol transport system auxiliary component
MRILSIVLIGFLLSACSLSPVKTPTIASYTLSPTLTNPAQAEHSKNTLLVSTPIASAGFTMKQMKYVLTPYRLQSFVLNQWVAPPADMLTPIFTNAIRRTHFFKAVVEPPFSGLTNYNLQTHLLSFTQNFMQPKSRFEMTVQANLVNSKTNQVVASKTFSSIVTAPENNPYSGVLAANKAVSKISIALARFVLSEISSISSIKRGYRDSI